MGRHSEYTPEIGQDICELLSSGQSVRDICKEARFPVESVIYSWLARHSDFAEIYARAREAWADAKFEEMIAISEDMTHDTTTNERGTEVCNHEWIARSRLRVDTLKWCLARMSPRKYGERIAQDIDLKTTDSTMTDEQKAARVQAIIDRAAKRKHKTDIDDLV